MRAALVLFLCLGGMFSAILKAQSSPPSNAATLDEDPYGHQKPYFWAPGSSVNVYIDSASFPTGSNAAFAVMTGFTNNALAYSNQGINYNSFHQLVLQPQLDPLHG